MTEGQWLQCTNPEPMLAHLDRDSSERKLRLFGCACCRRFWARLPHEPCRRVIEATEALVDGQVDALAFKDAFAAVEDFLGDLIVQAGAGVLLGNEEWGDYASYLIASRHAWDAVEVASRAVVHVALSLSRAPAGWQPRDFRFVWAEERGYQANLLREVFGNPFRPVSVAPGWRTATVDAAAGAAYAERHLPSGHLNPSHLAILADALEEAGCTDQTILDHLRGPGPHVRGCFALDAVLERQ
jgi:hypothetical protein